VWKRLNCTGSGEAHTWIPPFTESWAVGPMIFNLVFANLSAKGVSLQPALAPNMLAPLNKIATVVPNAVAGINGGYFYRIGALILTRILCFSYYFIKLSLKS
jgi:hypothetical protein